MSKTAFVFPGQGSQKVGMLNAMSAAYPSVLTNFEEASDALEFDLWAVVKDGPLEDLNHTSITQPALLTASVAIWREYLNRGGELPQVMAGHSLGEYSALTCAGVFSLADAAKLVHERGNFMQAAVPDGAGSMAAIIGLDDEDVIELCREVSAGQVVTAVNFNSPGQVVIAGHTEAVRRAIKACKPKGARMGIPLPVSVPCHCSLMLDAAEKLAAQLAVTPMSAPTVPVINNVDVNAEVDPERIRQALIRQLSQPVRWTETVRLMEQQGVQTQVECGPGKVLTGLASKISKTLTSVAVNTPDDMLGLIS